MNYILGAGPAGIAAAYCLENFKVLDPNPLGQLRASFSPGPRLIQHNEYTEKFVKSLFGNEYEIKEASVGYEVDGEIFSKPPSAFKSEYSLLTRDGTNSESSHLSEGKNKIKHIVIPRYGEDTYTAVMKHALAVIRDREQLVSGRVEDLDTKNKKIYLEVFNSTHTNDTVNYSNIINTLSLKLLKDMKTFNLIDFLDLETTNKSFYQCSNAELTNVENYDYIYSISGLYTRRTHFSNYVVYESKDPIGVKVGDTIEGNKVMRVVENLPIQIKSSIGLQSIDNMILLGRYAEWNHKVKIDQVLPRAYWLKRHFQDA